MTEASPAVLVVDDESDLADLYASWLADDYRVLTAYGGEEAIETVDETVDVALIDRRMPTVSGDEVLEYVRNEGYECRVAMVTAVEPDFDIIEMGFDEYLVKPIREGDLAGVVESLRSRSTYDRQLQSLYALASKRAALEARKSARELEASDAFADLEAEIERLGDELDRTTGRLTVRDLEAELRQLNADGPA